MPFDTIVRLPLAALAVVVAACAVTEGKRPDRAADAMAQGRFDAAIDLLSVEWKERVGARGMSDAQTLAVGFELGEAYAHMGSARAFTMHQTVLMERTKVLGPSHPDVVRSEAAFIRSSALIGSMSFALARAQKSAESARKSWGPRSPEALMLTAEEANLYAKVGRLGEAQGLQEEIVRARQESLGPDHADTWAALADLATTLRALGRIERAIEIQEPLRRNWVARRGEKSLEALVAGEDLATSYMVAGRFAEAVPLQERYVRAMWASGSARMPRALEAVMRTARSYAALDDGRRAVELGRAAYAGYKQQFGRDSLFSLAAEAELARLEEGVQNFEEAINLRWDSYGMTRAKLGMSQPETLAVASELIADYVRADRLFEASLIAPDYIKAVEERRQQRGLFVEDRQRVFGAYAATYRRLSIMYGQLGRADEGFRVAELSKARTLLESMADQRASRTSVLPPDERSRLDELSRRLAQLSQAAAQEGEPGARLRLESERNAAARESEALRQRLKRDYPKYAQLVDVQIIGAGEARNVLAQDAVFLGFLVIEERSKARLAAWVLDANNALEFRLLQPIEYLSETVDVLRRANGHPAGLKGFLGDSLQRVWRLPDGRGYRLLRAGEATPQGATAIRDLDEVARFVAERILQPLAPLLRGKRSWIISPDAPLAALPFELLPWGDRGMHLVTSVDIQYVQSLSVLALGKAKQAQYQSIKGRRALFAMGNAIYQPANATGAANRGIPAAPTVRTAEDLHELDGRWPNLPGTETEVRAVAALFGKEATVALGDQATEHHLQALNAKGALATYRLLLFSAHGYLSPTEPSLSSIVLGLVNRAPGTDGYVTAAEWPSYDLRSELAVFSACDSGIGKVASGEGVMGLPFALLVAGNVNTILSLWPVQDEATAEFMKVLFAKLKAGASPAKALNETKRDFRRSPRRDFASPSVWAPFVLIGPG